MIRVTLVKLVIFLVQVSATSSLLCLSCKGVTNIQDCLTLEECGANQKCFSNRLSGSNGMPMYNLGCADSAACGQPLPGKRDINSAYSDESVTDNDDDSSATNDDDPTCLECCNNLDGCNKNLCGANSTSFLRCLICRDVLETKFCNKFTECGQDQYCFVQRTVNPASLSNRYEMDCMGFQQCDALDRASRQDCATCCNNTDFCNYDACANWTPTNGSVSSPSTSAAPSTTPATVPAATTPSAQVVLDGPNNGSFGSRIELKCVTLPTAERYAWNYNGTISLPQGVVIEKEHALLGTMAGYDKLVIAELNESTIGLYSCIATINGHIFKKSRFVEIRKEKPTAHITKTLIQPYFALVCNTTGYPRPKIGWAFVKAGPNTGSVDLPKDADVTLKGTVSIVVVANYRPADHDGSWYCAARNPLGDVITEVDIP